MHAKTRWRFAVITAAIFSSAALVALSAQDSPTSGGKGKPQPMHRVGGARDGASAFPRLDYPQLKPKAAGELDFAHFHTYDETVGLLKGWAAKYPDLVDLYSV